MWLAVNPARRTVPWPTLAKPDRRTVPLADAARGRSGWWLIRPEEPSPWLFGQKNRPRD